MKEGNFKIGDLGELMDDVFDLKNIPGHGLKIEISFLKTKYLITKEKLNGKRYYILWEGVNEREWIEAARVINIFYLAKAIEDYAIREGASYYEIIDDKFTLMEEDNYDI